MGEGPTVEAKSQEASKEVARKKKASVESEELSTVENTLWSLCTATPTSITYLGVKFV